MSKPTHRAYIVSERNGESQWLEAGAVWRHKNGNAFDLVLPEGLSVSGRIVCVEPRVDDRLDLALGSGQLLPGRARTGAARGVGSLYIILPTEWVTPCFYRDSSFGANIARPGANASKTEGEMQQVMTLRSGAKVVTEIVEDDHGGEIVTHHVIYADGTLSTKTCTCTCMGKGSDSKTCSTSSNPTCDCTGSSARVSC